MKNIFLGALPKTETLADAGNDEIFVNNDPVKSVFTPYPLETSDKIVQLDETASNNTNTSGAGSDVNKVSDGGTVNTDGDNTGSNTGGGESTDVKSALNVPVIIGAAALIYFLFLRKK